MHVLIIGAAGMIGRKLVDRLVADGNLGGSPVHGNRASGVEALELNTIRDVASGRLTKPISVGSTAA